MTESYSGISRKLILPDDLNFQTNGKLRPGYLIPIGNSSLNQKAFTAWAAMTHYARHHDGIYFGGKDFYRTYDQQVALIAAKPGLAATPSTSAHGYGLAIDVGYMSGTYVSPETITMLSDVENDNWKWLNSNLLDFGFAFEMQDQPWHIRYITGDNLPTKVKHFIDSVRWNNTDYNKMRFAKDAFIGGRPRLEFEGQNHSYHVKFLQCILLTGKKFAERAIGISGIFDQATKESVERLQTAYGLTVNGIVDTSTWYAVSHEAIGLVGRNIW